VCRPKTLESGFIGLYQTHLADRGGGLQFIECRGTIRPTQPAHAFGDRAGRDQQHLDTVLAQRPICSTQAPMASVSRPRPSLVSSALPILTIQRRDFPRVLESCCSDHGRTGISSAHERVDNKILAATTPRGISSPGLGILFKISHDRKNQILRAFTFDGGDAKHRPLPAQPSHDFLAALLRLRRRHQIGLVEHQPPFALASSGLNFFSSAAILRTSLTGSTSGSKGAMSTRCSNRWVRARCLRKRMPRPRLPPRLRSRREYPDHETLIGGHTHHTEVRVHRGEG